MSRFFLLPGLLLSVFVLCGLVLPLSGTAFARPEKAAQNAQARFDAMDADKNGQVSREEFSKAHPQMKDAAFEAIDADKDGSLSFKEWEDFAAGHGKPHPDDEAAPDGAPGEGKADTADGEPKADAPELIIPPKNGR